jgi:DNA-binding NarL/FixJ family response regulator
MPSIPRIVVVDARPVIARIMHGAMALLSRQYILIEVPTAEDAWDEALRSDVALLVTAYGIPGEMNGIQLATRISHESLGTPVIVLAEENDPLLDRQALEEAPFQYFVRPVAEPFLRGLRVALDGEAAIAAEETKPAAETDLGPIPPINVNKLSNIVMPLMRDVGAMGVILADRTGRVLVDQGATGYIDREKLAVIMGPAFARSADVSPLVGGNAWTMHYYDGERLDVFGLSLGIHYFMCLIFEGSNRGAFGAVTMFGRRAADQMIEMIGEAAYLLKKPEPLPPPKQEEPVAQMAEPPARKRKRGDEAAAVPGPAEVHPVEPTVEPVAAIDVDALFRQSIDENVAATMFDPEALSDLAASLLSDEEERVGYDEAIDMGILDE